MSYSIASPLRTLVLLGAAVSTPLLSASSLPLTQWQAPAGNDHYYQVFFDANFIQWTDASANAQAQGGYLATITSAEENAFITALTSTAQGYLESWIGLTDALNEGSFVWDHPLDELVYTNWATGEPNNDPDFNGEDYAIINPPPEAPGTWNDLPNNPLRVMAWVVEWDQEPASTVPEPSTFWTLSMAAGLLFWFRRR